jgi:hypothetical protein
MIIQITNLKSRKPKGFILATDGTFLDVLPLVKSSIIESLLWMLGRFGANVLGTQCTPPEQTRLIFATIATIDQCTPFYRKPGKGQEGKC